MAVGSDVLERRVLHKGDVFIKEGEENARAYLIQTGEARAFTMSEDGEKLEVAIYGPGTIIGEVCLAFDTPSAFSVEAIKDSTVVTITRQDFERKLMKADSTVKKIFKHMMLKLSTLDNEAINRAHKMAQIEDEAFHLVNAILANMAPELRHPYEKAMLPHLNGLIKAIKDVKRKQKDMSPTPSETEENGEETE